MGRPSSDSLGKAGGAKTKKYAYKGSKLRKNLGSSKEGHGFAASKKRKFLSRFRRKFKKKEKNEVKEIEPLANDTLRNDTYLTTFTSTLKSNTSTMNKSYDTTFNKSFGTTLNKSFDSTLNKSRTSHKNGKKNPPWNVVMSTIDDAEDPEKIEVQKASEEKVVIGKKRKIGKSKHLKRVEIDYENLEAERKQKMQELRDKRGKHEDLVKKNIEKRKKVNKKLSKRTVKGQPVMANQLDHILSKLK